MSRLRLATACLLLTSAIGWGAAAAPAASAAPDTLPAYVLPGDHATPFAVAVVAGQYYATGAFDGVIYTGDLRQRRASVLVDTGDGVNAIAATATRLIVTENTEGPARVSVYDRLTGQRIARFSNGRRDSFTSGVALAANGDAYVTDGLLPLVYRIPADAIAHEQTGVQPLPVFRRLRGTPAAATSAGPGMASIVVTSDDRYLLLRRSLTAGGLFRVRLADRQVIWVDLHGATAPQGQGMILTNADVLYVDGKDNSIVELRLSDDYRQGRQVSVTHPPNVNSPRGMALAGDRLLLANFDQVPGRPPYTVSSIPLP